MRFSYLTPAFLLSATQAAAFAPSSSLLKDARLTSWRSPRHADGIMMSSTDGGGGAPPPRKVLTAADVMAKSAANKAAAGSGAADPSAPGAQEAPKIFTPATYDDFQSSLLLLEKRAKDGPGSLTLEEVEKFEEETERIVKEMREFMADPERVGERIRKGYERGSPVVEVKSTAIKDDAVASVKERVPPVPSQPSATSEAVTTVTPSSPAAAAPSSSSLSQPVVAAPKAVSSSIDNDEPPFDESVGFGLARGTTNTYVIPGMDEMSPEEYRAKLQETISARQAERRRASLNRNYGIIGNKSSTGYLDGLSRGGGGTKQG